MISIKTLLDPPKRNNNRTTYVAGECKTYNMSKAEIDNYLKKYPNLQPVVPRKMTGYEYPKRNPQSKGLTRELAETYIDQGMTVKEIAELHGYKGVDTVNKKLLCWGLECMK